MKKRKPVIAGFLLLCSVCAGMAFCHIGIKENREYKKVTEQYAVAEGRLLDYTVVSKEKKKDVCQMVYDYWVDGKEYQMTEQVSSKETLKLGSKAVIYYDPVNPHEAMLGKENQAVKKINAGILFITVSVWIAGVILLIKKKKKKHSKDFVLMFVGLMLIAMGYVSVYLVSGTLVLTEIYQFYKASVPLAYWMFPALAGLGLCLCIRGGFYRKKRRKRKQKGVKHGKYC